MKPIHQYPMTSAHLTRLDIHALPLLVSNVKTLSISPIATHSVKLTVALHESFEIFMGTFDASYSSFDTFFVPSVTISLTSHDTISWKLTSPSHPLLP